MLLDGQCLVFAGLVFAPSWGQFSGGKGGEDLVFAWSLHGYYVDMSLAWPGWVYCWAGLGWLQRLTRSSIPVPYGGA